MKKSFLDYLFTKNILVGTQPSRHPVAVLVALLDMGIEITGGYEHVSDDLIPFVAEQLGIDIPEPFYRGFPDSVRELVPDKLAYDKLCHYTVTYGFGDFSEPGHSLFEGTRSKLTFNEISTPKSFSVTNESFANAYIRCMIDEILAASRPASNAQYKIILEYITEHHYKITTCACKDVAIRLLLDTSDVAYASFLRLSDVIRLVEAINYSRYNNKNIKKLNLRNQDRRLISHVLDYIFDNGQQDVINCFEKKAIWCGILHHIHYKPKNTAAESFVSLMRGERNHSIYSLFEREMSAGRIKDAVNVILQGKGSGELHRRLNYIVSRCRSRSDFDHLVRSLKTDNATILIQLIMQYANYEADGARSFRFTRFNKLTVHKETNDEMRRRRSRLSPKMVAELLLTMHSNLDELLRGRVGRTYISPEMYNVAVPLQENTSFGGLGVMPRGSRIHIDEGKKIRAFTYWEGVNDIDLSVIAITRDGGQREFSWRTMEYNQSAALSFSGDQTAGFNGGSEYFDLDTTLFRQLYPDVRYMIFSSNVYSGTPFADCFCKAGYMLRDIEHSGEIYEPKTVKSSFNINCDSTFAYLFGIDLDSNDFVWLNIARDSRETVAGSTPMAFLKHYFTATSVLNLGTLFEMLASELVTNPEDADTIVADIDLPLPETVDLIRSYDYERISRLIR